MRTSFILTMASAIFLTSFLIYLHTYICYGQQNFFNHHNFKKQNGVSGLQTNKSIYPNNDGKPKLQQLLNSQNQQENFESMQPMTQLQPLPQTVNQNTPAYPVTCNHAPGSMDIPQQAVPNYSQQVSRPTPLYQQPQFPVQQRPAAQPIQHYNPPIQNYMASAIVMETPQFPPSSVRPIYGYDGFQNGAVSYPQYVPMIPPYPSYPVNTVIADQGSQSSSLKTLLPIILNLLKEKSNCNCRSCDCKCSKSTSGYCRKYPLSDDGPEIELSEEIETVRHVREPKKAGKLKNVIPDSAEVGESLESREEHEGE
ncbi:uncharacterized protein LOC110993448 [Pieris rapae]|uniref:uncharacterized protein LOC110993448 n=1 Tax=Pieris rapae TaxID=64459 RepID=UPI001E27C2D5|nr:uncharacterized protein LOC110993448 [Pieris rapae]